MNICRIIMLCTCLATPLVHTKGIIDEDYLRNYMEDVVLQAVNKSNEATYATVQRCVEKTAYTCIGVAVALCGCWGSTSGVKRIFFEKNRMKSGLALMCLGATAIFVGLNITTINP